MNRPLQLYFLILSLAYVTSATANQIHFSKVENPKSYQFNYRWLDIDNTEQSLNFNLEKSALFDRFRTFKSFKPTLAEKIISKNVVKHLRKEPITNVKATYNARNDNIDLTSTNNTDLVNAQQKIRELEKKYTSDYLASNFYHQFITHTKAEAIKPDHVKFARLSADDLKPMKSLILEKVSIKNIRKATNYILGFVQSIPYSRLESRVNSAGAGFNPPLKLLWENQGDCDSKVTLAASLLRTLMPRIKMVMVFIDNHALIGIDVLAKGDETTIELDGITYLLAEPTGPARLPLGMLDQTSRLAVLQGQYVAEIFH
jgi:hypothetical protein